MIDSGKKAQELLGRISCISCGSENLEVIAVIDEGGVPPGEPEHNIGYYHLMLARCQSCGSGLVERLDHDCFDHESIFDQYEWYILTQAELKKLLQALKTCPDSMSPECQCAVHNSLRQSIKSLPKNYWQTVFEDKQHEHRVSIAWTNGLPHLMGEAI